LIEEIDFTLRSKEKIHDLYTAAEIDLAAIIAADGLEETPEERLESRFVLIFILFLVLENEDWTSC
jgi:hypothetical protein